MHHRSQNCFAIHFTAYKGNELYFAVCFGGNTDFRILILFHILFIYCLINSLLFYTRSREHVSSRHLRSANQHQLIVLRCRRIYIGRWAFSVAGPTVWYSLPTEFRSLSVSFGDFRRTLKTILLARY